MPAKLSEVWAVVERVARAHGVLRAGASDLASGHAALFDDWLAAGHHAGMDYLRRHAAVRRDPGLRYPWAKSVIVILVPYSPDRPAAPAGALSNHVARYALGDDYHEVLDRILREVESAVAVASPGIRTWRYVDTGPLSDRSLAARAGLGWIAKNGMLIDQEHGSYTFIGTLLTSLENDLTADLAADRCGSCTRCLDACPTDAILADRTLDSHRCISYATIEHRGPLEPFVESRLAENAFGCDICQEVCPWNGAAPPGHRSFDARDAYRNTPLTDLLRYSQADFSSLFQRSAIKRAKLDGMKRNVAALRAGDGEPILTS